MVLRYCTAHCPDDTADDAALAALSLASLGLHHLRQRGSRGSVGSAAPAGGSIHSVASPTAASATADVASGGAGLPTWLPKLLEGDPETGFAPGMLSMVKVGHYVMCLPSLAFPAPPFPTICYLALLQHQAHHPLPKTGMDVTHSPHYVNIATQEIWPFPSGHSRWARPHLRL